MSRGEFQEGPFKGTTHLHGDAALAGGVGDTTREADVAGVAPEVAPTVLHDPVVGAVVTAIADHQHSVVQRCAAGRVEDSARIQLELALVRLDGDADRLVGRRLPTCHNDTSACARSGHDNVN